MGNILRMASYDRSANIANAIPALELLGHSPLKWHRLDDGVMGGRSETLHHVSSSSALNFTGHINTNGGGFTSIRAPLPVKFPANAEALKVTFRGDGKTYKILLTDGSGGGPSSRSPSWQVDLPTTNKKTQTDDDDEPDVQILSFQDFLPSFGPRAVPPGKYELDITEMNQIGVMLSLKLSDGRPNPPETFGVGEFDFSLWVEKIEVILKEEKEGKIDDTCET
uniref:NADH:ubiquinone oxidoreductase intermediate-associated protein 30 domain-containing protein n=1 Tax=Ditylum brightwellii TaxID=49249 RepID=A0A7S1ZV47_9STRA